MVRAVVECVDVRIIPSELRIHPVMQALYRRLVIVAARNAALVRDDDDEVAVHIRPADRVNRPLYPHEIGRIMEIVHVDVERAVAVEKDRPIRHRRSTRPH